MTSSGFIKIKVFKETDLAIMRLQRHYLKKYGRKIPEWKITEDALKVLDATDDWMERPIRVKNG